MFSHDTFLFGLLMSNGVVSIDILSSASALPNLVLCYTVGTMTARREPGVQGGVYINYASRPAPPTTTDSCWKRCFCACSLLKFRDMESAKRVGEAWS